MQPSRSSKGRSAKSRKSLTPPFLLGIDVGTTGCKAALFDSKGKRVQSHYEEYLYPIAEPAINSFIGQILGILKTVVKKSEVAPKEIRGLALGAFVGGLVGIDRQGKECLVWSDADVSAQTDWIKQKLADRPVTKLPGRLESQLLWVKEKRPRIYETALRFLQFKDYVEFKLTDEFATDQSEASLTLLYDFHGNKWSEEIAQLISLDRQKLPEIKSSTSIVGEITESVSRKTGLSKGTPVVAGAIDDAVGIIGLNAAKAGIVCDLAGTIEDLDVTVNRIIPEQSEYLPYGMEFICHAIPGLYIVHFGAFMAGGTFRWYRDQLGTAEIISSKKLRLTPYAVMDKEAEKVELGSNGLIFDPPSAPYIVSEHTSSGSLLGLTVSHSRPQIVRALMEGISFKLRENFEAMGRLGISVNQIVTTGGCARSRFLNQMKADVLGLPVLSPKTEEPGVLGAAVLAGAGTGVYSDPVKAVETMSLGIESWNPRSDLRLKYDEVYQRRVALLAGLRKLERAMRLKGM